ncbi:MAG: NfeD family protein [Porphyromonadaceae bacterium]|nr:NfeD family protein [Porphyromonadaceae bacterium]
MDFGLAAWQLWLIAAIGLFILEIVSTTFVMACFAVGSLGAMIVALCTLGWSWQVGAFAIVSLLSFVYLRSFMQAKRLRSPGTATGVEALIGRRIRLKDPISLEQDYIELPIDGDVWRARLIMPQALEAGMEVEVVRLDGIILEIKLADQ